MEVGMFVIGATCGRDSGVPMIDWYEKLGRDMKRRLN